MMKGRTATRADGSKVQVGLEHQVEHWPTPATRDHKGTNSSDHVTTNGTGRMHLDQVPNFVAHPSQFASDRLALPPNLADLCAGRDRAIALWLEAYDKFHDLSELAGKASIAGRLGLRAPSSERYGTDDIERSQAFLTNKPHEKRDRETGKLSMVDARARFASAVTRDIDRRCWDEMMTRLGLDQLLDRQAREEFQTSLRSDTPAFTVENCRATFGTIWAGRRDMYLRGIANVFMKMDRRFRSHDAFAIGNRLIIERAMHSESWGGWQSYNRRDTLHDVERILRELDGRGPIGIDHGDGIVRQVEHAKRAGGLPKLVKGDYFRVRVFQNGNLHLWFERKDLFARPFQDRRLNHRHEIVFRTKRSGCVRENFPGSSDCRDARLPVVCTREASTSNHAMGFHRRVVRRCRSAYADQSYELVKPKMLADAAEGLRKRGLLDGFPERTNFSSDKAFAEAIESHCGVEVGSFFAKSEWGLIAKRTAGNGSLSASDWDKMTCLMNSLRYASAKGDGFKIGFIGNEKLPDGTGGDE